MKKIAALVLSISFLLLLGQGFAKAPPSWQEWTSHLQIQGNDLNEFRSHLPKQAQMAWDKASDPTKNIAFIFMLGMKQANQGQLNEDGYFSAFKIANKAEAGFHLDKAINALSIKSN